jgi:hypothetical protein
MDSQSSATHFSRSGCFTGEKNGTARGFSPCLMELKFAPLLQRKGDVGKGEEKCV